MGGVGDWLFGTKDKMKKIPTGTKEQQAFHNSLLAQAQGMLQQGGGYNRAQQFNQNILNPDSGAFDQFASPYLQQFQEQILPKIAEQFAGAGALSSSGFGQALGGAGAGLQSQLAQLFSQLQQNAVGQEYGQFNQLSQTGLNYQPFAYTQKPGSAGMLGPLAAGIGTALAGPLGGMAASGISSLFTKKPSGGGSPLGGMAGNSALLAGLLG